ncbi:lamin tail domain-containing protein [Asanoa iriomotensis]|uniref:LTD domain-containing protein n=1 Tax=Asanoa iriomotensis TaxID=234613 RepID=A0ABQ4C7V2_9ACTN|nr:lamin tail domain-containing protein [Asanoa iriomotensis]GIF58868.1 hypothetical protein Air01nite_49630 [Asanoa iriomotensis]
MRKTVGIIFASLLAFGAVLGGAASASADPSHPGGRDGGGTGRPGGDGDHRGGGDHRPGGGNNNRPPVRVGVQIAGIQFDSPGRDNGSNASLNGEWISLVNNGRRAVNLRGYTIKDRANHVYRFGNVWIEGDGGRVRVHTGMGRSNGDVRYWGSRSYIWNNNGDTATLSGPQGRTIDSCSYRGGNGRTRVAC